MRRRYRRRPAASGGDGRRRRETTLMRDPGSVSPDSSDLSVFQVRNAAAARAVTAASAEMQEAEMGELAVPLLEVEAVADVQLVGNDEADVADGEVVHQPAVRPV